MPIHFEINAAGQNSTSESITAPAFCPFPADIAVTSQVLLRQTYEFLLPAGEQLQGRPV
jgi:hypothetical protein